MKTLRVCAATNLPGTGPVEARALVIAGSLPPTPDLNIAERTFQEEADRILEALKALPQGTRYALLVKLLDQAKVFYIGP